MRARAQPSGTRPPPPPPSIPKEPPRATAAATDRPSPIPQSLVSSGEFTHILRIQNTNVDGKRNIVYALTAIPGVGRRFSNMVCKRAKVDLAKRAGELAPEKIEQIVEIIKKPQDYGLPAWFFNRQKDYKTGETMHVHANALQTSLRDDLERLKKVRVHRGLRHYWGLTVRGQHTKTTGRKGKSTH